MEPTANPFAALSLIGAPAILTNASTVLVMSTSNRLARTVDRARELSKQLDAVSESDAATKEADTFALRELQATETRSLLLLRALRLFYGALSGFASSVFGSVLAATAPILVERAIEIIAVIVGVVAVTCLVSGAFLLIRETRIAVDILQEQTAQVKARARQKADRE